MLRNFNSNIGLCNGMWTICLAFARHIIDAEIVSGTYTDRRVFITRIELTPSDSGLPFTLRCRQFPVRLCYCMTMNKAQSQTLVNIGLYLPQSVFTHGQLYVGLSRARLLHAVDGVLTRSVVFTEVIQ